MTRPSTNPDDGVLLAETLLLGTDPKAHAVAVALPYHYLMVVPSAETFDGRRVVRLRIYGMDPPQVPKWNRSELVDGEGAK